MPLFVVLARWITGPVQTYIPQGQRTLQLQAAESEIPHSAGVDSACHAPPTAKAASALPYRQIVTPQCRIQVWDALGKFLQCSQVAAVWKEGRTCADATWLSCVAVAIQASAEARYV